MSSASVSDLPDPTPLFPIVIDDTPSFSQRSGSQRLGTLTYWVTDQALISIRQRLLERDLTPFREPVAHGLGARSINQVDLLDPDTVSLTVRSVCGYLIPGFMQKEDWPSQHIAGRVLFFTLHHLQLRGRVKGFEEALGRLSQDDFCFLTSTAIQLWRAPLPTYEVVQSTLKGIDCAIEEYRETTKAIAKTPLLPPLQEIVFSYCYVQRLHYFDEPKAVPSPKLVPMDTSS